MDEIGLGADARRGDLRLSRHEHLAVRLGQQALDRLLGLIVMALARMQVPDAPLGVDQVVGRPIVVVKGAPQLAVVVDGDRIGDAEIPDGLFDIGLVALKGEFRGVDADDNQALIAIGLVPGLHIGQRAQTVDARIGPEIDQHDLATQALWREWPRIDP